MDGFGALPRTTRAAQLAEQLARFRPASDFRATEPPVVRSRELGLRLTKPEDQARLEFTILLTVQTMNYLHSGRHRVAL